VPIRDRVALCHFLEGVVRAGNSAAWKATEEWIQQEERDDAGVPIKVVRHLEACYGETGWPAPRLGRPQLSKLLRGKTGAVSLPGFVWLYCLVRPDDWLSLEAALGLEAAIEYIRAQERWGEQVAHPEPLTSRSAQLAGTLEIIWRIDGRLARHLQKLDSALRAAGCWDTTRERIAWLRMVSPFVAPEAGGALERRWAELTPDEQLEYVRSAVRREVILLGRPRALQRALTVADAEREVRWRRLTPQGKPLDEEENFLASPGLKQWSESRKKAMGQGRKQVRTALGVAYDEIRRIAQHDGVLLSDEELADPGRRRAVKQWAKRKATAPPFAEDEITAALRLSRREWVEERMRHPWRVRDDLVRPVPAAGRSRRQKGR
jgi:hypothetical protein